MVHELVRGLSQAGHAVTLFATGDSQARDLRFVFREAVWPPATDVEIVHCGQAARDLARERFDVVHAHVAVARAGGPGSVTRSTAPSGFVSNQEIKSQAPTSLATTASGEFSISRFTECVAIPPGP